MRMTKDNKSNLANKMTKAKFAKRTAELDKLKTELFNRLYAEIYTPKVLTAMKALPPECLHNLSKDGSPRINKGVSRSFSLPVIKGIKLLKISDSDFSDMYTRIAAKNAEIKSIAEACSEETYLISNESWEFKKELTSFLSSFTSVKRLLEVLPEAKPYIDSLQPCSNIPMADASRKFVV